MYHFCHVNLSISLEYDCMAKVIIADSVKRAHSGNACYEDHAFNGGAFWALLWAQAH